MVKITIIRIVKVRLIIINKMKISIKDLIKNLINLKMITLTMLYRVKELLEDLRLCLVELSTKESGKII